MKLYSEEEDKRSAASTREDPEEQGDSDLLNSQLMNDVLDAGSSPSFEESHSADHSADSLNQSGRPVSVSQLQPTILSSGREGGGCSSSDGDLFSRGPLLSRRHSVGNLRAGYAVTK